MKPRSAKAKGTRLEKWAAQFFADLGWSNARRQPGGGIYDGFAHDAYAVHPEHGPHVIECKARKAPLLTVQKWMGKADILIVRQDRVEPIVIMPAAVFQRLAKVDK